MNKIQRIAFLFPGQGAQYPGMAQDFVREFSTARRTFDEGDDALNRSISKIILGGAASELTETKNSQAGIYIASMAILRVVKELYDLHPFVCAGLSLGEYTALTAAEWLPFMQTLPLVECRGQFMNDACESTKGAMAVIMGLDGEAVEEMVKEVNLPNDLWVANYNCPGQVVISGSVKGVEAGTAAAKGKNAKRVLPLQVHGAFHSGLMQEAQDRLSPYILEAPLKKGEAQLVMNVPGDFVVGVEEVRSNLIQQVTRSVRWEQGIRAIEAQGIDLCIEFGPGKTLSGMNKRIGVQTATISIEKVEDLKLLETMLRGELA